MDEEEIQVSMNQFREREHWHKYAVLAAECVADNAEECLAFADAMLAGEKARFDQKETE